MLTVTANQFLERFQNFADGGKQMMCCKGLEVKACKEMRSMVHRVYKNRKTSQVHLKQAKYYKSYKAIEKKRNEIDK